jgi:UDP-N-acetylmuramyl pentapeptide phosphotransferase/UDP-N-acetylglucosamine-1-phosphate transferase
MILLFIVCALVAGLSCAGLLRLGQESARRYGMGLPQRFHAGHVPRLGGLAMMVACSAGWAWMSWGHPLTDTDTTFSLDALSAFSWWFVAVCGVAAGVLEDITGNLRPSSRFVSTVLAALLATVLFGLSFPRTGFEAVDVAWQAMPWIGILTALVLLTGLPHAFNLIDGYNGLAGTVALICCLALAYVSLQVSDPQLAGVMMVLAGATAGFLLWNYPHGLIFAGDGGAYLWGVVVGIAAVLLVQRHGEVSPLFPVLLLIYPIWEAVFSIYRKTARGQSPSVADALHFHQLIYRRVVRQVFHDDAARRMLMRNNRTSPYLWGFTLLTVVPAVLFWDHTWVLAGFTLLFMVSYVWAYHTIVQFRMQRWLRWGRRQRQPPP